MIISFSIENWRSFRDKVTFLMTASKERQHSDRVPKLVKYQTRILPIAVLYGGNASGKTNFFKAINFAKGLVVKGTRPESIIPIEPFRLDAKSGERPSRFSFELLVDESLYEFDFAVTRKEVLEEKLVKITPSNETILYDRKGENPNFDKSLVKDKSLEFAFKGTRENQLFLTNSVSQKIETFKPVYDWFKDNLELVAPDSRFEPFEQFLDEDHPRYLTMNEMLHQLDTGIEHLGGERMPFENIPMPEPLKNKLKEDIKEGITLRLMTQPINERFIVTRKEGELIAKKLVAFHPKTDGSEVKFDIQQESDGSQRVIDLLPAFLELSAKHSKKVYVIDELDRSLHTLLTRQLLNAYLSNCSYESRSQLLLTTHDALLMDQQLLRRDEMWIAERNSSGVSKMISFSEYKDVRYDKDIRKSYLQGRLGGIPRILSRGAMANFCGVAENDEENK